METQRAFFAALLVVVPLSFSSNFGPGAAAQNLPPSTLEAPDRAFVCDSESEECYCWNMKDCMVMKKMACKKDTMEPRREGVPGGWLYKCKWKIF